MYRVILIDDERLILRGLSTVIPWKELGCEVVGTASDGLAGLGLIRSLNPDILFTDIRMPNMDGLTMLAALRSEFSRMQITVLTAYRDFDYARQALTLGVCRYLLKPSDLSELKEAVETMVRRLDQMPCPEAAKASPAETPERDGEGDPAEETEEKPERNPPESGERPPEEDTPEASPEAGSLIVDAALAYMRENCTRQHLSLVEVADHVYVSQWHLSKLLNRRTGRSFFELLGSLRVEKAKFLLKNPALHIQDVAEQTGYTDVAHFSKSFKKLTGRTPGEYRNSRSGR